VDPETMTALRDQDRIALQYVDNPNGSMGDIAGVLSENRRVLGLMPHPERAVESILGSDDGKRIFESALQELAAV
jgi:phosphoribosylformylglycinamidine synthase